LHFEFKVTFYLKYRPQTIAELDLGSVREQLTQALGSKTLPHAFLFAGPRGLGKTSAARILAKAINCQQSTDNRLQQKKRKSVDRKRKASIEPCNRCDVCLSITQGRALDVIEIDGASNRGIDDIRELKGKINLSPVALAKKVYVIDEVHMLTKEAFNALLKTLEEPPEHAVFILATTEPDKLPPTIVSRCFRLLFHQPTHQEISRSLERVIKGEKLSVDPEVLSLISQHADGSFRDAHKILEQLAFAGKKIDRALFESVFKAYRESELLQLLVQKDVTGSLSWLKAAQEAGVDWKTLIQILLETIRQELLAQYGIGSSSYEFSENELKQLVVLLTQAASELKRSPVPHLPLEVAVIEFCSSSKKPPEEGQDDGGKQSLSGSKPEPAQSQKTLPPKPEKASGKPKPSAYEVEQIKSQWEQILKVVKPKNHSIEALLRSARPLRVEGNSLVIEVFYEFHKGRLETAKCRSIVEQSLQQVMDSDQIQVKYILGERGSRPSQNRIGRESDEDDELVKNAEAIFTAS
jgi:DNA polymerase-3 subunit gamma/tau